MYDELVKRLRDWPKVCAQYDGSVDQLHDEAADAIEELSILAENGETTYDIMVRQTSYIEELQKKIPRWIPVTERLPDGEVLALNNLKGSYGYHEYLIGYVCKDNENDSGSGYLCASEDVIPTNVTHWMSLPEPPKEEQ